MLLVSIMAVGDDGPGKQGERSVWLGSRSKRCAGRETKLGHFIVEFATPGIGHILKGGRLRFLRSTSEHSGFSLETAPKARSDISRRLSLPAFVRVPAGERHFIARACDIGAEGIMVPMVGTAAQAEAIVRAMKYLSRGESAVSRSGIAHDNYAVPGRQRPQWRRPMPAPRCSA